MENDETLRELTQSVQKLSSMQPLILHELERISDCYDELHRQIDGIDKTVTADIRGLNTKATVWGLIGGALPAVAAVTLAVLFFFLRSKGI